MSSEVSYTKQHTWDERILSKRCNLRPVCALRRLAPLYKNCDYCMQIPQDNQTTHILQGWVRSSNPLVSLFKQESYIFERGGEEEDDAYVVVTQEFA